MRARAPLAIGVLLVLGTTQVAAADEPPAPPPPAEREVAEVRVIGNKADSLQRVPGSGTVITRKDLQRAAPVDTAEMLRRVPGVQVRQEYSGGGRLDISIRGLDAGRSRRVLILEDGMPLALNPYSEPDMYFAPFVERYRAIEVVKGSGNILFGPQTLAGTINFVTIAPPDHQTAALDLDAGNFGYLRGVATYGDAVGGVRYVTQLVHRRGDGFRDQAFASTNGLAKVAIPTGQGGEAMLKLGFQRDEADSDDVGLTSAMYRRSPRRPTLSPESHLILDRFDASLAHEQRLGPKTKLKTLLYGYVTGRIWRRQEYTRTPVLGETYDRVVGDVDVPLGAIYFRDANGILDRSYDVVGLEPRFEHKLRTGSVEHTLDFGGRLLRETAHYEQRNGGYAQTYAGSFDYEEKHTGTAFAGYLQDKIAFRDDLLVTPGIRVERLNLRRAVLRQGTARGVEDVSNVGDQDVTGVIPGVGMIYGTKRHHVFGGMHVGFAPPRITSAISPRGIPAPVSPERSINYELGTRVSPFGWTRLETTGFLSNFSNQVIINTAPGADVTLADAGATNIYGVEAGGTLQLHRAFKVPTVVEVAGQYTFSRARFREGPNAGNLLPYAPQHQAHVRLDVEHATGLGGQLAYSFLASQFSDATNIVAEDVSGRVGLLPERHIVDATVHYRHKASGLTFRLSAKNLLDATYINARRPEGIFPGAYRQVLLGVRWEWERRPEEASARKEASGS